MTKTGPKSSKNVSARISHDAAARVSHDSTAARISDDRHDKVSWSNLASSFAGKIKELVANRRGRRVLLWAKRLGLTGVAVTVIQQAAMATAPQTFDAAYNPVAELFGFHRTYAAITNEPSDGAPESGDVNLRTKYAYEMRLSVLDTNGTVVGRFRGDSLVPAEDKDPRWWSIKGDSDGKLAQLRYTNEKGELLGMILLKKSKDSAIWVGYLTGIDRSISNTSLVQSPIIVAQSRWDLARISHDKHLDKKSVLVAMYDH